MDCDIHLVCSKGYFIVKFHSQEATDITLKVGSWLWGSTGLFSTPWFPDFNANMMEITRMSVWVRLYNLRLHFWNEYVLEGIGNNLGRYIKTDIKLYNLLLHFWNEYVLKGIGNNLGRYIRTDIQRLEEKIFTFA